MSEVNTTSARHRAAILAVVVATALAVVIAARTVATASSPATEVSRDPVVSF